jgi:hypothetical protein
VGRLSLLADKNLQSSVPILCAFVVALVSIYIAQISVRNVLVAESVTALYFRESSENILALRLFRHCQETNSLRLERTVILFRSPKQGLKYRLICVQMQSLGEY